jgi:hypothetical protein
MNCKSLCDALLALLLVAGLLAPLQGAERPISFNRDIKPILASKCFACHGPDESERQADLRLDDPAAAHASGTLQANAEGAVALLVRVTSSDPEQQMPPAASKKPGLSADEVALMRRWIAEGAKYDAHWAFVPPVKQAPPEVADAAWSGNAIDRFIRAGHEANGLTPSPEADKRTLLRRLTMDLTGLPPTAEEVAAFEADDSPEAYEKVVERLLASPQYGERMAMYWLDIVRYADSAGYHSDNLRNVTPYREYVIRAFNENRPFDQFAREQLAGDLLPNATLWQKVASGYNRLLQTTEEGGAQPKEYTAKYAADRARNFGSAWLALTTGCCECHDHKFDPLTARDFYRLEAFFADIQEVAVGRREPGLPVPSEEQAAELVRLEKAVALAQQELDQAVEVAVNAAPDAATLAAGEPQWRPAKYSAAEVAGQSKLVPQDDGSLKVTGTIAAQETYVFTLEDVSERISGLRVEALTDDALPAKGPGTAPNGNFVLSDVSVVRIPKEGKERYIKIEKAIASHEQAGQPIAAAIDRNAESGWAVLPKVGQSHEAVFQLGERVTAVDGAKLRISIAFRSPHAQHNIGRIRLSVTGDDTPADKWIDTELRALLSTPEQANTPEARQKLAAYFRERGAATQAQREKLQQVATEKQKFEDTLPRSLISVSGTPRTVRILPRGNWLDESGEIVDPAPPAFLGGFAVADRRATRLDLAEWLLQPEHPLTSRVFVNRVWKLMFGRGLNKSVEDFGTQGEYPSHPELLDYLAVDFRENGWNVKQLVKQIVMTRTYRQSSLASDAMRERDPANIWLARQSRFRYDAENVRDNALAVSGLLVHKIGGPSVFPYQPPGYWAYLNFPVREWENSTGEGLYRRGLYTHWQRSFLHPSLVAFDAPSREECTVDRPRSNTPLQALVLLNDPTYVEAARALAAKTMAAATDSPARLEYLYRQALQRSPRADEASTLLALYEKHFAQYTADPKSAGELMTVGAFRAPESLAPAELAAWTSVARVVLNLHETITRN